MLSVTSPSRGALRGVRVLDLSSVVLGPLAAQMLGDMGADVIKIEAPEGDLARSVGPARTPGMGALFLNCNRNKRSLALNLKHPDAAEVLARLIADSDVVLHSVRTQAAQRIGLTYEAACSVNPRIVFCHVGGFSDRGPYSGLPAFDDIIQAASGLAQLQSIYTDEPRYLPALVADKTTAVFTAYAIVTALFHRERTGVGQAVDVPMFETMTAFNLVEHLWGHSFSPPIDQMVYGSIRAGVRRPFRTKDGFIALVPYTNDHWLEFFRVVGRAHMATDPRFATLAARTQNFSIVFGELGDCMLAKTTDEWIALFRQADIPAMRINSLQDLPDDAHLNAVGFWQTRTHPTEGELRMPGIPYELTETPGGIDRLAPRLGVHTQEVLLEFGWDAAAITALAERGVVMPAE